MMDPVRDSFQDLLLSGSEHGHSSPSRGASHDPTKECFTARTPKDSPPLARSPEGTLVSVMVCVASYAPLRLDLPCQKSLPRLSPSQSNQCPPTGRRGVPEQRSGWTQREVGRMHAATTNVHHRIICDASGPRDSPR